MVSLQPLPREHLLRKVPCFPGGGRLAIRSHVVLSGGAGLGATGGAAGFEGPPFAGGRQGPLIN